MAFSKDRFTLIYLHTLYSWYLRDGETYRLHVRKDGKVVQMPTPMASFSRVHPPQI